MGMFPKVKLDYSDGRTKQSFKDSTDINKILAKAEKAGTLSHLEKYEAEYGDFSDFDFMTAQLQLAKGKSIFDELPAEIRREFNQNPAEFFEFVNDPANAGELKKKLPELAAPGRQRIILNPRVEPEAPAAPPVVPEAPVEETPAPAEPVAGPPESPPSGGPESA